MDLDDVWTWCRDLLDRTVPLDLTHETCALLSRAAQQVAIPYQDAGEALRALPTAMTLVREIHQRIGEGSRRLDRARNQVEEIQEGGRHGDARQILRDVLAVEVVPFYREQVELLLAELTGLENVFATGQLQSRLHDRQQLGALSLRVQQGHALDVTEDLLILLRRTAPTAAISDAETEEALKSAEGAETLARLILSRFRESERRFLDSMYRMTRLRDSGDLEAARQQMRDVLAVEVVPQYRRMAEEQLEGLNGPPLES